VKRIMLRALREYRAQIIGWGVGVILLGLATVPSYEMVENNAEHFAALVEGMPRAITAFFGDMSEIVSAKGYLTVKYYSFLPLVLGFFAIFSGSGMITRDEEAGVLDLVLAHPVRRSQVFFGRLVASTAAMAAVVLLCWIGLLLGALIYPIPLGALDMLWPLVSLFALLMFLQRFSLAVSQLLPSRRLTSFTAITFLFASFFITGFGKMNAALEPLAMLSPITHYQSGDAITRFDLAPALGLLIAAELFGLLGYWRFEKRDIRLSGEGGFDSVRKLLRRA